MTKSQELYQKAKEAGKLGPKFLQLGEKLEGGGVRSTGPHRVKFVSDKVIKGNDIITNQEIEQVQYTFEENGVSKIYNARLYKKDTTELNYLVQKMAEYDYGQFLTLEMRKKGIKNYISIEMASENVPTINVADIPIVEEEPQKVVPVATGGKIKDVPYDAFAKAVGEV